MRRIGPDWLNLSERQWRNLSPKERQNGIENYIKHLDLEESDYLEEVIRTAKNPLRACITTASKEEIVHLGVYFALSLASTRFEVPDAGSARFRISDEWRIRANFLPIRSDGRRPDPGVFRGAGHRVGRYAWTVQLRRDILDALVKSHIPPLGSKAYYQEWGNPETLKRIKKVSNVLRGLINMNRNKPSHEKAVQDWKEDLYFIEKSYSFILKSK